MATGKRYLIQFSAKEIELLKTYLATAARREVVSAMINEGPFKETCKKNADMLLSAVKKLAAAKNSR